MTKFMGTEFICKNYDAGYCRLLEEDCQGEKDCYFVYDKKDPIIWWASCDKCARKYRESRWFCRTCKHKAVGSVYKQYN